MKWTCVILDTTAGPWPFIKNKDSLGDDVMACSPASVHLFINPDDHLGAVRE